MLNFWDYMVIALYVVALVVVGWLASKKVKNARTTFPPTAVSASSS